MKTISKNSGFASVALIIFTVIATTIITAASYALINSSSANTQAEQSTIAMNIAESGIENGLVRFSRDIGYTGETLLFSGGRAIITKPDDFTLQSRGIYGDFVRTIQVKITDYVNTNNLTINSWQEVY
jgi:hypothetical protein